MKRFKKLFGIVTVCYFTVFPTTNTQAVEISAYKTPAFFSRSPLDHTYTCIDGDDAYAPTQCTSTGTSTKSGGDFVTAGDGNSRKARCYSACKMNYGRNGVCHQHTNRVLYTTRKILPLSVKGYRASRSYYGAWGTKRGPRNGRFYACFKKCR